MIRFFDVACRGRTFNGQAQLHSRGNSRQAILVVSESIPHRIEFLSSPLTPSPWTWLSHRASALANRDYLFTCKTDKDLSWRTIVILWSLAIRVRSFDRIGVSNDHVRIFFRQNRNSVAVTTTHAFPFFQRWSSKFWLIVARGMFAFEVF